MAQFKIVPDYFIRRDWNETWDYPITGSLIGLEKHPVLSPFFFSWEINYAPWNIIFFTRTYYWIGRAFTILYLFFVWLGPKLMENRKPFDLRTPLKYWNLLLALFSIFGTLRVVPHLVYYVYRVGFFETLCVPPIWSYATGSVGCWVMLFVYSKYFELLDTVFIVLRKKKLSFLHWYHHATVLLYTWEVYLGEHSPGIHFCAMNYAVHAIMYFYYYLSSGSSPPKWGIVVTVLQIAQMIMGVVIGCICLYLSFAYPFIPHTTIHNSLIPFDIPGCYLVKANLVGGMAMYSTYFYLFLAFFWRRYVSSRHTCLVKKNKIE